MSTIAALLLGVFLGGAAVAAIHSYRNRRRMSPRAVCILASSEARGVTGVTGIVTMRRLAGNMTEFVCDIHGLAHGKHGFHVHECGDLRGGCKTTCAHYNPYNCDHGSATSHVRHAGDLGNVLADTQGRCISVVTAPVCLSDIMGRAIVIHAVEDDLGLGGTNESRSTGTAGERVACGIIAQAQA
jgi:superoxide dismutase, Cu-Zn family